MFWGGVYPAMPTPFDKKGRVATDVLEGLVDFYASHGVHGLYLLGSTGEGLLLTAAERKTAAKTIVRAAKGRLATIIHVGAMSTTEAAELAEHAETIGADAISSVPPIYYRVGDDGVIAHYRAIATASALPLIVYNIPALAGVVVNAPLMARLQDIPTVRGIKFSDVDLIELNNIAALDQECTIFNGRDEILLGGLVMGADGGIGGTYPVMPQVYLRLYAAYMAGNLTAAQEAQEWANRVTRVLVRYGVMAADKIILGWLGYPCGVVRQPLANLTQGQESRLRQELEQVGFFDLWR